MKINTRDINWVNLNSPVCLKPNKLPVLKKRGAGNHPLPKQYSQTITLVFPQKYINIIICNTG